MFRTIQSDQIDTLLNQRGYCFIDLRSKKEFLQDGLHGNLHIPFHLLAQNEHLIPKNKTVVLVCNDGKMSAMARNFINGRMRLSDVCSIEQGLLAYASLRSNRQAS